MRFLAVCSILFINPAMPPGILNLTGKHNAMNTMSSVKPGNKTAPAGTTKAPEGAFRHHLRAQWLWNGILHILQCIAALRRRSNQRFGNRWSDARFVMLSAGIVFCLSALMLWFPAYLGVGNDGSVTRTMQNAGLSYLAADEDNANNYFTRVYQTGYSSAQDHSLQLVLIRAARGLDHLFTHDQLFDIRFLSLIYVILALPAWSLLFYSIVSRVRTFTEKCILSALCVLIFADGSYITYFNSLYPEAVYIIGLSYLFGGCMMLQRKNRYTSLHWLSIILGVLILCSTRQHAAIVGFITAVFCMAQLRITARFLGRIGIVCVTVISLTAGFCGSAFTESDFDDTSRIHAMTRGVLLQSNDPEETLQEFGINGSYALLTDVSLYDEYPLADESEYYLQNGFLDHCSAQRIALHYLQHPGSMLSMLDLGARSAVNLRRESCGSFERSTGKAPMSKSIVFSAWSIFKLRSFPKTIAFPLLLVVVCILLARKKGVAKRNPDRFYYVFFCTTILAAAVMILNLFVVICCSGDAQLIQYNFIAGFCLDCLVLFTVSELLHWMDNHV